MDEPSSGAAAAAAGVTEYTAVTVNIKQLNGPDFELAVRRDELVSNLKAKIREQTNIDEARQRLIYRGKVLADAEPLSTYKVESGHFIHMVARPVGVPAPAAPPAAPDARSTSYAAGTATGTAAAAAAGTAAGTAAGGGRQASVFPNLAAAARAGLRPTGGLSDRLLMGMGAPATVNAAAAAAAATAAGVQAEHGRDALLSAAAGLEQGDFLSNMLAIGAAGGARAAGATGGGGRRGVATTNNNSNNNINSNNSVQDDATRGSGVRGQGAASAAAGGENNPDGQQGSANLEHVRQGLLTLHTLLSGTTRRRRSQEWSESSGGEVAAAAAAAAAMSHSSEPSRTARGTALGGANAREQGDLDLATAAAALDMAGSGASEEEAARAKATPAAAVAAAPAAAAATTIPTLPVRDNEVQPVATQQEQQQQQQQQKEDLKTEARAEVASSDDPSLGGDSSSDGSPVGGAWVPPTSRDEEQEGEEGHGHRGSRLSSHPESGSEPSEGPPRLLSESEDSDSGGGEDEDGRRNHQASAGQSWSRGFLRGPHDAVVEEEESKDDGSSSGRQQQQEQQLRRRFFVGQWLDVKDTVNNWLEATVMDMTSCGSRLQIHYNGWPPRWDEWLNWDSPRIAPFRTRTQHLPQAQHVSPAPVSAVRNAPRTGPLVDDVRVLMPEVQRVLQEIGPMVDELSTCYAQHLERDPSTSPTGGRAVSHTLPWTRQRLQLHQQQQPTEQQEHTTGVDGGGSRSDAAASPAAATELTADELGCRAKAADLAGDVAPLFDRLGRMLTDVAPHLARLSARGDERPPPAAASAAAERGEDSSEPGELPFWRPVDLAAEGGVQRRSSRGSGGGGGGGSGGGVVGGGGRGGITTPEGTTSAFRQLVSTSSPAPTSNNINIHIHAIVPLRGPPSPPPPPPPPPPTASASAVATPTRAERPPLASGGVGSRTSSTSSNNNSSRPWNSNGDSLDTVRGSASLIAAARAAASSRAAATSTSLARGGGGDSGSETDRSSVSSRGTFLAPSFPTDLTRESSPLTVSTPGSLPTTVRSGSGSGSGERARAGPSSPSSTSGGGSTAAVRSAAAGHPGSSDRSGGSDWTPSAPAPAPASTSVSVSSGSGHRRGGGWRGLLRAFGVGGGSGNSSRVSSRRDGGSGGGDTEGSDQTPM